MKTITWRTKVGFRFTISGLLLLALFLVVGTFFNSSSDTFVLLFRMGAGICIVLFLIGYISSFLSIISKQEKRSTGLIVLFVIASLIVFWIGSVLYLGSTGLYD
ncbi:hypothetical protein BMT55_12755 [Listeria newyorkensis]|uniref:Uncharacterized protein n=1 Tax=Listeria newyorkensis TaxID=1497681 RepID=A0ABX4XJX3_9LIST|nr:MULTISPECIES: hypothetical protein [Listeria]KGL42458.1 hypothetical protein EP56_09620 [Listeriaceae bacterium FSL A5-0209]KGL45597.1 hypothetical protein EP58_03785 [Listeria newyorkensis]PNP89362.1 hypothetical protein BMT55_12755 [Listeria newyorkensis]RQW66659.1 hypothetical protein DUK53_11080 [Listeria sp. SHR_NRA_18]WAO22934.1 hypothetical protein OTR81_06610 [Listeria newyorkensis]